MSNIHAGDVLMLRKKLKKGAKWQEVFELVLKDIEAKEKITAKLEKVVVKTIKQTNAQAKFIRSLKAKVLQLQNQIAHLDRKLSKTLVK